MYIKRDNKIYFPNTVRVYMNNCDGFAPEGLVERKGMPEVRDKFSIICISNPEHIKYLEECDWLINFDDLLDLSVHRIRKMMEEASIKQMECYIEGLKVVKVKDDITGNSIVIDRFSVIRDSLYKLKVKMLESFLLMRKMLKEDNIDIADITLEDFFKYLEKSYSIDVSVKKYDFDKVLELNDISLKAYNDKERTMVLNINYNNEVIGNIKELPDSFIVGKLLNDELVCFYKESKYSALLDFIGRIDYEKGIIFGEYWKTNKDYVKEFFYEDEIEEINKKKFIF